MASDEAPEQALELMAIEVVFSPAARLVDQVTLRLPVGSLVVDAVQASGVVQRHTAHDLMAGAVGIWGRPARWDDGLTEGDRIELYRPLQVDPKEARCLRYRAQGERGRRKPGLR
jgi:putative ubiquitin-RnfH superfamily antitoxin RatB of RatAB toxin-antitoxin module